MCFYAYKNVLEPMGHLGANLIFFILTLNQVRTQHSRRLTSVTTATHAHAQRSARTDPSARSSTPMTSGSCCVCASSSSKASSRRRSAPNVVSDHPRWRSSNNTWRASRSVRRSRRSSRLESILTEKIKRAERAPACARAARARGGARSSLPCGSYH